MTVDAGEWKPIRGLDTTPSRWPENIMANRPTPRHLFF
jgi:hypothetical protein